MPACIRWNICLYEVYYFHICFNEVAYFHKLSWMEYFHTFLQCNEVENFHTFILLVLGGIFASCEFKRISSFRESQICWRGILFYGRNPKFYRNFQYILILVQRKVHWRTPKVKSLNSMPDLFVWSGIYLHICFLGWSGIFSHTYHMYTLNEVEHFHTFLEWNGIFSHICLDEVQYFYTFPEWRVIFSPTYFNEVEYFRADSTHNASVFVLPPGP